MALNLIVLGPPGAGKGTQASQFAAEHRVPKISTGDILRDAIQAGTELGRKAQATMDTGRLVSDDVMIGIVRDRLSRPDTAPGFVLDGFPRTVTQAVALDEMLAGRPPLIVVDIRVADDELVRRLQARRVCSRCGTNADATDLRQTTCSRCGGPLEQRSDDAEHVVRERLRVYARDTKPLVEYYQRRPTFRSIDGSLSPEQVARALRAAVESALPHRPAGEAVRSGAEG